MGSPEHELGRYNHETQHEVTLTRPFCIQTTEVTNQQYMELAQWAVDNGYATAATSSLNDALDGSTAELLDLDSIYCEIDYDGSVFNCVNPNHPVLEVSWYGSVAYCDWLSMYEGIDRAYDHSDWSCNGAGSPYDAAGYRLPTEAEWEYACRAGSTTSFANGEITNTECSDPVLDLIGWYCGNNGGYPDGWTHPAAQKIPNSWGLYDMHGNIYERCNDWRDIGVDYLPDPVIDPEGPVSGDVRVIRGGFWNFQARYCRSANRAYNSPYSTNSSVGFRLLRSAL